MRTSNSQRMLAKIQHNVQHHALSNCTGQPISIVMIALNLGILKALTEVESIHI